MQMASSNPNGMPASNGNDFPMKTMMDQQQHQQEMPSYQANGSLSTPGSLPPKSPLFSSQSGSMGLTSPGLVGAGPGLGSMPNPQVPASQVGGTVAGVTNPAGAAVATKRPVRRGGKPQPERPIRALFCLGLKNPIRKICIDITEWK